MSLPPRSIGWSKASPGSKGGPNTKKPGSFGYYLWRLVSTGMSEDINFEDKVVRTAHG